MFPVDHQILVLGALLLVAIASSRLSTRLGLPLLVLFVGVGMLAGTDGPGGIDFDDFTAAHAIGTVALILILFDGGLRTSVPSIRRTVWPASVLSSLGVVITAGLVGSAAAQLLELPLEYGLLLGAIVSSTDAAAVFAALRSGGLHLRPRLGETLEVESGSNDPMAVLLTVGCLEYITGTAGGPGHWGLFLLAQVAVGGIVGWLVGRGAHLAINRVHLPAAGLYPILTLGAALLSFGTAAAGGGSGFLAVYVTGIVLGNHRLVYQRGVLLFHDGMAWLGQIVMFMVLGLLATPSRVQLEWDDGVLLAGVLMLVARPVAVAICLAPFRYGWREIAFASWAGLKGAVPIILGTYPLMFGVDNAARVFDSVFFVVLVSVTIQGWSLGPLARALRVTVPPPPQSPVTVEVSSLQDVDADIVSYRVGADSRVAHHRLDELGLPAEMVIAMVVRDQHMIVPKGRTVLLPGDQIFVTLRPSARWLLDHVFSPQSSPLLSDPLAGTLTLAQLRTRHGVALGGEQTRTLAEWVGERLAGPARVGGSVREGMLEFTVLETDGRGMPGWIRLDLARLESQGTRAPKDTASG